jgi:hypothetical protein
VSDHEGERLSAYLDGELPPGERLAVEAHLAACASCTALLDDMRAVDAWAASLPAEAPGGYFETFPSRVVARVGASRPSARVRRLPAWTWAAAAALLLAVVAPLTLRREPPVAAPKATTVPPAPRPASGGLEQKRESDAPSTPVAPPAPAARAQPAWAPPPTAPREVGPGGATVAESPRLEKESSRNEAPAASRERQEPAPVTTQSFAEPESPQVARGAADAGLAAPMSSVAREGAAGAGAVSLAEPDGAFSRLEAARPRTAVQWRRLRDAWSSLAGAHPDDPRADEARVRAIEAAREAWLLSRADEDGAALERDARAYLARPDAAQEDRVRRLLPPAPRP